ncbi:hypothetical protein PENTCL1PPCAC_1399, partial [Pristionchus entomophagus]
ILRDSEINEVCTEFLAGKTIDYVYVQSRFEKIDLTSHFALICAVSPKYVNCDSPPLSKDSIACLLQLADIADEMEIKISDDEYGKVRIPLSFQIVREMLS